MLCLRARSGSGCCNKVMSLSQIYTPVEPQINTMVFYHSEWRLTAFHGLFGNKRIDIFMWRG